MHRFKLLDNVLMLALIGTVIGAGLVSIYVGIERLPVIIAALQEVPQ